MFFIVMYLMSVVKHPSVVKSRPMISIVTLQLDSLTPHDLSDVLKYIHICIYLFIAFVTLPLV
jgi:hypothetical protein